MPAVIPAQAGKPDERALWAAIQHREQGMNVSPRAAGRRLGIHPRRVEYLCEKWARLGIYDWGVVCDLGWPTGLHRGRRPRRRHWACR